MPQFDTYTIIKWLHLVTLALGGGAAMIALLLMGLEESQEAFRGLSTVLYRRTASWAFRAALVLGLVLLAMKFRVGDHPFQASYLHWKLTLVFFMVMFSEMTPKALAQAKRGAPLMVFVLFLLTTFVTVNKDAFGYKTRKVEASIPVTGALEAGK